MPAAITHYFQAKKAYSKFIEIGGAEQINSDAFLWGAQGPDFFFCHNFLPWRSGGSLKTYASQLHGAKPSQLLCAMRDYSVRNAGNGLIRSYLYGFLCHYSMDRTAHPFVYYSVNELKKQIPDRTESFLHCQIESALDVIILRYEKNCLPTSFNLKKTVPKNMEVQKSMSDLYADVISRLFGVKINPEDVLQATKDCRTAMGMLNDRTTFKKALVERHEKKKKRFEHSCCIRGICEDDSYDYANILNSQWRYPADSTEVRNESFFDLYERSISESADFMLNFYDTDDLSKLTGEIPFG